MSEYITNWMGQDIFVGAYVFRGARDGNTSSFKVGKVLSINAEKKIARIQWLFEPGYDWKQKEQYVNKIDTKGSPSIDTLCLISVDDYTRLQAMSRP